MEILRTIAFYTENRDMPFLVIGGHAINSLGFSRHTGDLDLLVPLRSKVEWQSLLARLRYNENQSDSTFSRFSPPEIAAWPIDLMYVDNPTFEKLQEGAVQRDFGLVSVPVVGPLDLDLVLPDAPDFISKPPRYSVAEMIKLSEPLLPFWNRQRAQMLADLRPIEAFRFIEEPELC